MHKSRLSYRNRIGIYIGKTQETQSMNSRVGGPVAAQWIGRSRIQRHPGFALVASLILMMLLVLVGLSLLTLSSTSLSISGRDADLAEARANARMALSLAIA